MRKRPTGGKRESCDNWKRRAPTRWDGPVAEPFLHK